ncbi:unnamed protein product [Heligmosomoides polygyrus]|uniref:Transposase n=1 Tax=Heligmosomoides polygyrus TaxID=6339 RepID=A0A183FQV2_HELPZ|nr:unnamed protein product [Heligmosomoides polygyrus]
MAYILHTDTTFNAVITNPLSISYPQLGTYLQDVVQVKRKVVRNDVGVKSLHKRLHVTEEAHVGWLNLAGGTRRYNTNAQGLRGIVAWMETNCEIL